MKIAISGKEAPENQPLLGCWLITLKMTAIKFWPLMLIQMLT